MMVLVVVVTGEDDQLNIISISTTKACIHSWNWGLRRDTVVLKRGMVGGPTS